MIEEVSVLLQGEILKLDDMVEIASFDRNAVNKDNILKSTGSLIGENLICRYQSQEEDFKNDKILFSATPCLLLFLEPEGLKRVLYQSERLEARETAKFISSLPVICKLGSPAVIQDITSSKLLKNKTVLLKQGTYSSKVFIVLEGLVRVIKLHRPEGISDIAFEDVREFEDQLMLAEAKFSNLPPMTVIRDLARGGVINFGCVLRNKKSAFEMVVESDYCEIAEIDGDAWKDILVDAGWRIQDLTNFECDPIDKLEKQLPALLTKLYGDPQMQQDDTKRDKILKEQLL